jgi:two-component system, OmpR family, phosphate regulon sensor histidine kinase PhoR
MLRKTDLMDNRPKVLVVDDEKGLRLGTKRLLENEGYEVITAANGSEGIKSGTSEEFDIAVIDLKMPDYDGIQVLKEIRNVYPNTICFIATAYASYDTAIESTKLGAYGYIPKPFTPDELLRQIKAGYDKRLLLVEKERWRKEREERLLEVAFEKTRLNTIINSITDGVLVVNKDGEAVLYNPSALIYLQLSAIKIEEYIVDKLHPQLSEMINSFLKAGVYESKSYSRQIEVNPGHLFIEATSSPVPHPDGSLAGVVIVIKDISELKKIEHLKSQFVSMVSHELKAPISAVHGFLNLLLDNKVPLSDSQKTDFLQRSQTRLDSLIKMVNDLLDISRMEMKSVQREIKELNPQEIISGILELFRFDIQKKELKVNLINENGSVVIMADREELTRIYTNLISNAIKYNIQNGEIKINFITDSQYLITEIKDTGIGLKPEEKEKLFREFFRAKNEKTKNISGTGLGLSIVKRIIDSYAGKIEVDSIYNEGTVFKVYLPLHNPG